MSRVFWNIQQAIFRGPVKRTCGRVGGKHANGEIYVVLPSFRVGPYSFPAAPAVEDLAITTWNAGPVETQTEFDRWSFTQ